MRFPGLGSLNTRKEKKGIVMEDAIYETNAAALRAIANAQKLTVKVIGKNAIVVRDFAPANFEKFKNSSPNTWTEDGNSRARSSSPAGARAGQR